ncbi:MAG: DUF2807 domain-containing protein [Bacteroidetes bacterium]|nr:DUF2807 domain-containing protein [Bacteroidota bacterium]
MKTLSLLTLLAITLGLSSCYYDGGLICTKPNGEMAQELREVSAFKSIDLMMAADVVITPGEEYTVEVSASENILDIIKTEVSGQELNIRTKTGECIRGNSNVTITITAPNIEEIKISGSGNITNTAGWETDQLELRVTGSGDINLDDLVVKSYEVDITGSGSIELSGTDAEKGYVEISGSGDLDAYDLAVNKCEVSITGSGTARVSANDELDIKISGSGDVYYKGKPSINQSITGSGNVHNQN